MHERKNVRERRERERKSDEEEMLRIMMRTDEEDEEYEHLCELHCKCIGYVKRMVFLTVGCITLAHIRLLTCPVQVFCPK